MNGVVHVPFVDLSAQYRAIQETVDEAMADVLHRTAFILGQEVELFEHEFATFCGTRYAAGVDSGLSALELILRAYEIGLGDEVVTVANTFIATAFAISCVGATPILVDADAQTYNLDVTKLEQAITPRTRAILPVHLYGQPADMDPILKIAHRHGLVVIEDACQAHGARYKGQRVGSLGHAAAFSFYPAKNLGAYGDGGMVVTNDERVAQAVRTYRNYGQRSKYDHVVRGYNHRLDTLQAAVLRVKLEHLADWNGARRENARQYNTLLAGCSAVLPIEADYAESVYHLYVIRVERRDELRAFLHDQGIATGIHYPIPIHLQPAYQGLGYRRGDFAVSERCAEQILSLPMYPELETGAIAYVADSIKRFERRTTRQVEATLVH